MWIVLYWSLSKLYAAMYLVMLKDVFYQICIFSPIQFSNANKSQDGSSHMSILTPQWGCEFKLPMQSLFKHNLVGLKCNL